MLLKFENALPKQFPTELNAKRRYCESGLNMKLKRQDLSKNKAASSQ
jgi:hypothetical protein